MLCICNVNHSLFVFGVCVNRWSVSTLAVFKRVPVDSLVNLSHSIPINILIFFVVTLHSVS